MNDAKSNHTKLPVSERPATTAVVYTVIKPMMNVVVPHSSSTWYLRDELSFSGTKFIHQHAKDWRSEVHGEWRTGTSGDNQFGKSRRAYAAIESPFGRLAFGKQRTVSFDFFDKYLDFFNHANSPDNLPPEMLFFIRNMLSYKYSYKNFNVVVAKQVNESVESNLADIFETGISYDFNGAHASLTYQENGVYNQGIHLGDNIIRGALLVYPISEKFYGSIGYVDRDYQRPKGFTVRTGHALDMSLSYAVLNDVRLKVRTTYYDNGRAATHPLNKSFKAVHTTIEWQPTSPLKIHFEFINKSFDNQAHENIFSLGIKYKLIKRWQFD